MVKRYGLGWLDLEVTLAADLTLSAFKAIKKEKEEEYDVFMFKTWLSMNQTYAIKTVMSENPKPFPTFEEFKAPKTEKNSGQTSINPLEKEELRKEAERINKKFGGVKEC